MTKQPITPELQAQVDAFKAQGHSVSALMISGTRYIYRSINREEFKELQDKMATEAEKAKLDSDTAKKGLKPEDPQITIINTKLEKEGMAIRDRGEERLVAKGLIHPLLSANTPAGVLTTIADNIMLVSGYGVEAEPELL